MTRLSNITSDFNEIQAQITNDLNTTSESFQALYPSSTATVLANLLAGVSALWNHKIEQASLNLFTDTAYGYQTVYSLAKTKGYTPANKYPSTTTVRLDLSNISQQVIILKGHAFIIGDYKYYADAIYTASASDTYLDVTLTQGEAKSESFTTTGSSFEEFTYSSDYKLTEDTTVVYVSNTLWTNAGTTFFGVDETSQSYITNSNSDGTASIVFGNNTYGKIPVSGSNVVINYYINDGSATNSTTVGQTCTSVDGNYSGVTITTIYGGKDEEDAESIKYTSTKLAFTDDNSKLITRDNFAGYLYRRYNVNDGKAWGAYEETLKTVPDITQMNKIYYTVVSPNYTVRSQNLGHGNGTTTQTLSANANLPILPGSAAITAGAMTFSEAGGLEILCEDTTTETISGGTASATHNTSTAGRAFDGNLNTHWDAGITPTMLAPVQIGYVFSSATNCKAVRLRSIAVSDPSGICAPKYVKIYVTTAASPVITDDTQWTLKDTIDDLGLVLSNSWSKWVGIKNASAITGIKFVIYTTTTPITTGCKIGEIQMLNSSQVSTINYDTGAISLHSQTAIATTTSIDINVITDNLEQAYVDTMTADLQDRTLFTTKVLYKKPIARMVDIYCNVYYQSAYEANTVKTAIETALRALFDTPSKLLGSTIYLSDIYATIKGITGVTYVDVMSPTTNLIMSYEEFPVISSLNLNMEIANG